MDLLERVLVRLVGLSEAAVTPKEARSAGLALFKRSNDIVLYDPGFYVDKLRTTLVSYAEAPGRAMESPATKSRAAANDAFAAAGGVYGYIVLSAPMKSCGGARKVKYAAARKGYGPFLYDVAMAFSRDGGLMPDRTHVSALARRVWQRYAQRPDVVVEPIQQKSSCPTHDDPDNPELDYVYRATRVPSQTTMLDRHFDMLQAVRDVFRDVGLPAFADLDRSIERRLSYHAAGDFFNDAFDSKGEDR